MSNLKTIANAERDLILKVSRTFDTIKSRLYRTPRYNDAVNAERRLIERISEVFAEAKKTANGSSVTPTPVVTPKPVYTPNPVTPAPKPVWTPPAWTPPVFTPKPVTPAPKPAYTPSPPAPKPAPIPIPVYTPPSAPKPAPIPIPAYTPPPPKSVYNPDPPVAKTKVYFAFPDGNPGYTFIQEMRDEFGAEYLDAGSEKIQQPAVIFYLAPGTPRFSHEIPRYAKEYQLRCENVVAILMHPNGEGILNTYDWVTPSVLNGERVMIRFGFTTRLFNNGLTSTLKHAIQDQKSIFDEIRRVIAMAK